VHPPGVDAALVRHPMIQGVRPAVVLGNGALAEVVDCALTARAATVRRAKTLRLAIIL